MEIRSLFSARENIVLKKQSQKSQPECQGLVALASISCRPSVLRSFLGQLENQTGCVGGDKGGGGRPGPARQVELKDQVLEASSKFSVNFEEAKNDFSLHEIQ